MQPLVGRRSFLRQFTLALGAAGLAFRRELCADESAPPRVMTVLGPIRSDEMGVTLTHEHVLVDFIGADRISRDRYQVEEAFVKILPHLKQVRELGGRTLLECTPAYLGRAPALLQRLATASGMHLVTNTGYYGAADNKFLPGHAFTESADQLADRWLKEWREGIDRTKVRPGFIKIGVGGDTLSDVHRKLVRAAARTHRVSGLTVASHTGPAKLALAQVDVLREEGVAGRAFVWVHAQAESDLTLHLKVAEAGAWVSLDGYGPAETKRYVEILKAFRERGRLGQVLLSHDAGWYRPGEPEGGEFRPFDALFRVLVPSLKEDGFSQTEIDQLLVRNPAEAFAIRVRTP